MANTVSPASDQLTLTCQESLAEIIPEYYGNSLFPVLLCPPTLFAEIIRINSLRARAAAAAAASSSLPEADGAPERTAADLRRGAREVLERVLAFCPQEWTDSNKDQHAPSSSSSSEDDGRDPARLWLLLSRTYQSATALYCIASLRGLGLLPRRSNDDEEVEARRVEHRDRLGSSLREALVAPELKLWLMWPLVVAGMNAGAGEAVSDDAGGQEELRGYVRRELGKMATGLGTPLPLTARGALDRFWGRGGGGWDECFDRPYAFVA